MRTLRLTLAYDGTDFAGWQAQPDCRTVQETLEAAVYRITGEEVRTLASGRTDAGVHALGQVVSLRTASRMPADVLCRALTAVLPEDVAVLDAADMPEGFHPIRDAVAKRYRYLIHDGPVREVFFRRYCWHFTHGRLDAGTMDRAAATLKGTHDFSSFETSGAERKSSVRTVSDLWVRRGPDPWGRAGGEDSVTGRAGVQDSVTRRAGGVDSVAGGAGGDEWITLEIEADGFLYNMVRAIVGTLAEVGRGAQSVTWPGEVLAATDRRAAGPTAPPQGLFLVRVDYQK